MGKVLSNDLIFLISLVDWQHHPLVVSTKRLTLSSAAMHAGSMPQVFPRHARSMPEACSKHVQSMPEACPRYSRSMPKKYPKHARSIPEACPKHARNIPEACPKYARSMSHHPVVTLVPLTDCKHHPLVIPTNVILNERIQGLLILLLKLRLNILQVHFRP